MTLILVLLAGVSLAAGQTTVDGRPAVVLESKAARVIVDLLGGSIVQFKLSGLDLNPLAWNDQGDPKQPRSRAHFVCLDRWGAPSEAELNNGMPFHGEATKVEWKVAQAGKLSAEVGAALPMAGLEIRRRIRLSETAGVFAVIEDVTNKNRLGRVYNMVQHATVGPPFLDENVVVDTNARRGFMQSSPLPNPEAPEVVWPQALKDGMPVNLRFLKDDPLPNVVSYAIDEPWGWVTASNPAKGLLIGYLWDVSEYPWLNLWRHVADGRPLARGLEFGTTGLHQPFPTLVKKGRIFGRPLLAFLDAGQTETRSYLAFLAQTPLDYRGVARVARQGKTLEIQERGPERGRTIRVDVSGIVPWDNGR